MLFTPVSTSFDRTARIWDAVTGDCLHKYEDHMRPIYAVAISPDGKFLATGGGDGWLHIYHIRVRPGPLRFFVELTQHLDIRTYLVLVCWIRTARYLRIGLAIQWSRYQSDRIGTRVQKGWCTRPEQGRSI